MGIFFICLASFLASLMTFFSGFGLGTALMPITAIFFPIPVAIAITAIVHLMSKIFKLALLWRYINNKILIFFGLPALLAAIPGALLLDYFSKIGAIGTYHLMGVERDVVAIKLVAGLLLILFATAEWKPFLKNLFMNRRNLPFGGLLSGFFGGLTGNQGAFRSAFLVQEDMSEKEFVATNAAIAALVDITRLIIYGLTFDILLLRSQAFLICLAVFSSFLGIFLGTQLIGKVTIKFIQRFVAIMMYILGILLCLNLI